MRAEAEAARAEAEAARAEAEAARAEAEAARAEAEEAAKAFAEAEEAHEAETARRKEESLIREEEHSAEVATLKAQLRAATEANPTFRAMTNFSSFMGQVMTARSLEPAERPSSALVHSALEQLRDEESEGASNGLELPVPVPSLAQAYVMAASSLSLPDVSLPGASPSLPPRSGFDFSLLGATFQEMTESVSRRIAGDIPTRVAPSNRVQGTEGAAAGRPGAGGLWEWIPPPAQASRGHMDEGVRQLNVGGTGYTLEVQQTPPPPPTAELTYLPFVREAIKADKKSLVEEDGPVGAGVLGQDVPEASRIRI